MKNALNIILLALTLSTPASAGVDTGEGIVRTQPQVSLNGTWEFQLNNGSWSKIKVPGNWEMQGFDEPKYGKNLVKSSAIYRRTFMVPDSWKGNLVRITFDGINYGYSLTINGQTVGEFHSSYTRRSFDITHAVKFGTENQIEIKVETQPRGYLFDVNDDWSLSGISRPVYLSMVPDTHIEDYTIRTTLQGKDAMVSVNTSVEGLEKAKTHIEGEILDANNQIVGKINEVIKAPHLWTAETPYLYKVRLKLMKKKKVIHQIERKFGIREIKWDNAIFKVNGVPVKIKGVNHHDISPTNGRAISDEELLEDVLLMKKANINAIRMSHYPPSERLLELCDSMGMYVIDEVPYGFGDQWLGKSEYLPDLQERAYYTLLRDKNHPSVVIWSVGNENPVTDIGLETGKYVYRMDPTRPYVFPQTHKPFAKMFAADYDSLTMYSLHYPSPTELRKIARETRFPVMHTEYAHALGLDFGQMQDVVERWYQYPQLAGGCVWMLFDQGILRKSEKPVKKDEYTPYAWVDANTYYDTFDDYGADGILYANRKPQVDYWQVRKVYAPVVMQLRNLKHDTAYLRLINRYDFTDLKDLQVDWTLKSNNQSIQRGKLEVSGASHDTIHANIPNLRIPKQSVSWLELSVSDQKGNKLTEQSFRLDKLTPDQMLEVMDIQNATSGKWDKNKWMNWLKEHAYARLGKKRTMSETAAEKTAKKLWPKNILPISKINIAYGKKDSVVYNCSFDCDTAGYVDGTITLVKGMRGETRIHYSLTPHGNGQIVEAGLTLRMPGTTTTARWIGNGPYACYPGKNKLDEFGVWQLNTDDAYFPGNRQNVSMMMLNETNGKGILLYPEEKAGNIALERYPEGIMVSHNMAVSKPYNKSNRPSYVKLKEEPIKGTFSIISISENWSRGMKLFWGAPTEKPESYVPFFHSYDQ